MVRWMYFATGTVHAAYLLLVCGSSLSISSSPDSHQKFLERFLSPESAERKKQLKAECIDIAKKVIAEDMQRVLSRKH